VRDGIALDGCRLGEAESVDGFEERPGKAEFCERVRSRIRIMISRRM